MIESIIKWVANMFDKLTTFNFTQLTFFDLLIFTLFSVGCFFLIKWVLKFLVIGSKSFWKGFRKRVKSSKEKCTEIQCPFCGRTLEKCMCPSNKNLSYRQRLKVHKNRK